MLHHSVSKISSDFEELVVSKGGEIMSAGTNDFLSVLKFIDESEFIYSSSLHGLICADSLGVPNTWIKVEKIHAHARFKFYDYALSVSRTLGAPISIEDVGSWGCGFLTEDRSYLKLLPDIKSKLRISANLWLAEFLLHRNELIDVS